MTSPSPVYKQDIPPVGHCPEVIVGSLKSPSCETCSETTYTVNGIVCGYYSNRYKDYEGIYILFGNYMYLIEFH